MITVPDEVSRVERRRLAWAIFASVLFNLLFWPLCLWLFGTKLVFIPPNQQRELFVVSSSALRIERKAVPQPQSVPQHAVAHPQPQRPVTPHVVHEPPKEHHELAREIPNAPPQPPRKTQTTLAQQIARDERQFAKEAQKLNASNSPLSVATPEAQPPAAWHRSYMDLNGKEQQEHVFAVLTVRQKFQTPTMHCYYVRYDAQFSGGGTDDGNIPWPVCYPRDHDAMLPLDHPHALPVPAPQPGYVLPTGTVLSPLLQQIYDRQIQN